MAGPERSQVTFESSAGITLSVLLGDGSPILNAGVVTWDTVARPKRASLTRFSGRAPYTQDIPILFDGHATDDSQEERISKLTRMASAPHIITLSGHALRTDLEWVFIGIDWDNQNPIWIRSAAGAVRTRQPATVHLQEYIADDIIKTAAQPKVTSANNPSKKVTVPKGMTLKQISQIEYGDPDKWMLIVNANMILIGVSDPRYFVPAGIELVVPGGKVEYFTVP